MSEEFVSAIESAGVRAQKPFHARYQIGLGCFDHQMKMIVHQAIRMNLPVGLGATLAEGIQKELTILFVLENGLLMVASIHHMINCAFIFHSKFARHGPIL
jgi:hypothetical protein